MQGGEVFRFRHHALCFGFTDHLYFLCLLASEGYLISDDFVLDRVTKRSVEDDSYRVALDESHFLDAFTETAVTVYLDDHGSFAGMKF